MLQKVSKNNITVSTAIIYHMKTQEELKYFLERAISNSTVVNSYDLTTMCP
jgi:hypothetical protein